MATLTEVTTPPSSGLNHIDALLDRGPGWNWLAPARTTLYYTFDLGAADPNRVNELTGPVTAFNVTQQAAVVSALALLAEITGITFALTGDATQADLHFAAGNLIDPQSAGLCSWANSYSFSGNTVTQYRADAWIYFDNVEFAGITAAPTAGNAGFEVLLHELGHAMGLKHPFEGSAQLTGPEDSTLYTLMSYNDVGGPYATYRPYDIAALRFLYGGDGLGGLLGHDVPGNFLTGTAGADLLEGGPGNDRLEGGPGNDTLRGGAGNDTAVFSSARALYTITTVAGTTTVDGPDGIDTLQGIEILQFSDLQLFLNALGPQAPTGTVTVGAPPRQGEPVSAVSTIADGNGLGPLSLQWQLQAANGTWSDIAGATGTQFTPTQAEVGLRLRVVARYVDGDGTAETVTGPASDPVLNVNDPPTGEVGIDIGQPRQGQVLQFVSTLQDLDGLGPLSVQWQSSANGVDWTNLPGATGLSFTPGEAQVGLRLRVRVDYVDGQGTPETVVGVGTLPVANVNDPPQGALTLSGTTEQGQTLRVAVVLADDDGLGPVSLAWQRSFDGSTWVDIPGATGTTYTADAASVGAQLRAVARYVDGRGTAEEVPSPASMPIVGVQVGGPGDDLLVGTPFRDRLAGGGGRDVLEGRGGDDELSGGEGLDTAVYAGRRADFDIGPGGSFVKDRTGAEGHDTLQGIERLRFADQSLAFDLDGAAGTVARLLGAVFGREAVGNAAYAGIGLQLADAGTAAEALADLALQARFGGVVTAEATVTALYRNLLDIDVPAGDMAYWLGAVARGEATPASLAVLAAGLPQTAELIGLPTLVETGLAYWPAADWNVGGVG